SRCRVYQPGLGWQQPVMQLETSGQGCCPGSPHFCLPAGQTCSMHCGGSCVFPMQISHVSHGLMHEGTCVHGLHFVGSLTVLMLQLPVPAGFSEPSQTV